MIRKMLDTLTGKALNEALKENSATQKDLKESVAKARERIDAERNAAEAEAARLEKAGNGK